MKIDSLKKMKNVAVAAMLAGLTLTSCSTGSTHEDNIREIITKDMLQSLGTKGNCEISIVNIDSCFSDDKYYNAPAFSYWLDMGRAYENYISAVTAKESLFEEMNTVIDSKIPDKENPELVMNDLMNFGVAAKMIKVSEQADSTLLYMLERHKLYESQMIKEEHDGRYRHDFNGWMVCASYSLKQQGHPNVWGIFWYFTDPSGKKIIARYKDRDLMERITSYSREMEISSLVKKAREMDVKYNYWGNEKEKEKE